MYSIFTYIYHRFMPNVGKYSIHGAYGSKIKPKDLFVGEPKKRPLLRGRQAAACIQTCGFILPHLWTHKYMCIKKYIQKFIWTNIRNTSWPSFVGYFKAMHKHKNSHAHSASNSVVFNPCIQGFSKATAGGHWGTHFRGTLIIKWS